MNLQDLKSFSFQEMTGMSLDILVLILIAAVIVLVIIMAIMGERTRNIRNKYEEYMKSGSGKSLEQQIHNRLDSINRIERQGSDNAASMDSLRRSYEKTFQKMGLVKYDAFDEMGGKLSFTLALLNKNNSGFILNAVHSREGCYTYMKEVINGNAVVLLGEEEKEALAIALKDG